MPIYYVCTNLGIDTNNGSESSPFKTIQYAASIVKAGDTVLVQPGIYRERVSPINSGTSTDKIIFRSIIKNAAIIRGSIPWKAENYDETSKISVGNIDFFVFTDFSHNDGNNPFLVSSCVTPYNREGAPEALKKDIPNADSNMKYCLGQVFVDDEMYKQCPYKTEMENTNKSWFYDSTNNKLYVHGETKDKTIEITNQRRLFAPHKRGLKYIVVDGFVLERCGNQYPNQFWLSAANQQAGAIGTRSGKYWTITNNIIRFASGIGIDWGNEGSSSQDLEIGDNGVVTGSYGHIINKNIICDNGAAGTAAYMAKKFNFSNNIVERNNNLHFYGKRRWESAGLKIHCPSDSVIYENIIRNNYCHGIWSDQGAGINSLFQNNIIINNEGNGINFEIGQITSGKVVNNIFYDNDCGVTYVTSGGVLITHNLFIKSRTCDIQTIIFNRPSDKWDSLNVEIYYNMFFDSPQFIQITPPTNNPASLSSRFLNYNTYAMEYTDPKFQIKIDSKSKTTGGYKPWTYVLESYSLNGMNYDEKSQMISTKNTANMIYDEKLNQYKLILELTDELKTFPIFNKFVLTSNMGASIDYYGEYWGSENCFSGPFKNLQLGKNELMIYPFI